MRKAQSIMEYVMLFAIVAGAMAIVYTYVHRSVNARLKEVQEEVNYEP
jgi:hypothetical protein